MSWVRGLSSKIGLATFLEFVLSKGDKAFKAWSPQMEWLAHIDSRLVSTAQSS